MIGRKYFLTIFLFLIIFIIKSYGAWLRNIPQTVIQPNGDTLKCFASGDEFHNWLHDKDDYTIIQDPITGYYTYAIMQNGNLIPSQYIAGKVDPAKVGLIKGANISPNKILEKKKSLMSVIPQYITSPDTGVINNIIVFIRFFDESEFTTSLSVYNDMFNSSGSSANSMYNYFFEVSYNKLAVTSTFYPIPPGSTVVSYQDSYVRAYYQPYNSVTNPIGYQNSNQRRDREHILLKNAINAISSQVPPDLNVDTDNDGYVDNVCFIVYGSPDAWADLLWPHMWSLFSQTAYINGKRVWNYNFNLQSSANVSVLCHEMSHTIGFPDLYHYTSDGIQPVGPWDIMEQNSNPPQHMGAYMKYRYTSWIPNIPQIGNGTYSLKPLLSPTNNCYKILSPYSSTQYFVVEYRKREGIFESSLPGSGLLVYRINSERDGQGNASGPPDEVYVYRPNGTLTSNGSIHLAAFSKNFGRTMISDSTNPSSFLANGNPGGLVLWDVGSIDTTITFNVGSIVSGPYFYSNRTNINFSSVALGESKTEIAYIFNGGGSDLYIYSVVSDNAQFIVTPTSCTLSSLGGRNFSIKFQPTIIGAQAGKIIFYHNASATPDTILVQGTGLGTLTFNQDSIDYGSVLVGGRVNKGLTVKNNSASTLVISSIVTDNDQFTVSPSTLTIPSGSTRLCQTSFRPTSGGEKLGNLIFTHSGFTSPDTVKLRGFAIPTAPIFSVLPTQISFGNISVGREKVDSIVVTNTGNAVLYINSIISDNSAFFVSNLIDSIQPNLSRKYYITFKPTIEGVHTGNIIISHNADGSPDTVFVSGKGGFPYPVFSATPLSINFNNVYINTSKLDSIEIINIGSVQLEISSITSDNARFSLSQSNAIIPPISSGKIYVLFSPEITGLQTGKIIFVHNAEGSPDTVSLSGTGVLDVVYDKRWNLASLPLAIESIPKDSVFPNLSAGAYCYHKTGYSLCDTVTHGVGYWIRFPSDQIVTFNRQGIKCDTIQVYEGWNLIGSISFPVPITEILPYGTTLSPYIYGYNRGYHLSDTIYPGKGYWVRASSDGKLILSVSGSSNSIKSQTAIMKFNERFNSLSIKDAVGNEQILYFGKKLEGFNLDKNIYLPPEPPEGMFDVRFASQKFLEVFDEPLNNGHEFPIFINSAESPITISWDIKTGDNLLYKLVAKTDVKLFEQPFVDKQGKINLNINQIASLILAVSSGVPSDLCLFQNYPNPFNPKTTIKFGLPWKAKIIIKVFNVLGEEMATLIDQEMNSGFHTIDWDAGNYPSGVYYYRLQADKFTISKKLLLLR